MSTKDFEDYGPSEPFDDDEMFSRRERGGERGRPQLSELVRRAIENTVGQVQSTSSVSREALHYLLQQGDRGKREVVRIVAKEVGDFLRQTDLSSEAIKVLTGVKMEVNASIAFRRSEDGGVRPEVEHGTSVRVQDEEGQDLLREDAEDGPSEDLDPTPST